LSRKSTTERSACFLGHKCNRKCRMLCSK
jgi:hypothetical protein